MCLFLLQRHKVHYSYVHRKNTFQFGNIGVLGSSNWWYCEPLDRGAYSVISDNDEEEVLVELNEEFLNMVKKRDENGGK